MPRVPGSCRRDILCWRNRASAIRARLACPIIFWRRNFLPWNVAIYHFECRARKKSRCEKICSKENFPNESTVANESLWAVLHSRRTLFFIYTLEIFRADSVSKFMNSASLTLELFYLIGILLRFKYSVCQLLFSYPNDSSFIRIYILLNASETLNPSFFNRI